MINRSENKKSSEKMDDQIFPRGRTSRNDIDMGIAKTGKLSHAINFHKLQRVGDSIMISLTIHKSPYSIQLPFIVLECWKCCLSSITKAPSLKSQCDCERC